MRLLFVLFTKSSCQGYGKKEMGNFFVIGALEEGYAL